MPPGTASPVSFTVAQHLVSAAAGDRGPHPRRGVRERLAHLLDVVEAARPPARSVLNKA